MNVAWWALHTVVESEVQMEGDVRILRAGETALALAAGAGALGTVRLLLEAGGDPNLRHPGGAGPLHRAATTGAPHPLAPLMTMAAELHAQVHASLDTFFFVGTADWWCCPSQLHSFCPR